jgi:hypothetical protein
VYQKPNHILILEFLSFICYHELMTCSQCNYNFNLLEISSKDGAILHIEECLNCGGHFLEGFQINNISFETARNIDSVIPKKHDLFSTEPKCHQCGQPMFSIKDDTLPKTVTVFSCPNSHGSFFPQGQLLLFKKAQDAKINFSRLWGIPLKTIASIIIPLFVIFTSVTILPSVVKELNKNQENRVKASEILTTPLITPISDTEILISFSTINTIPTNIVFTKGLNKTFTVSDTPTKNHILSVIDLPPQTTFKYIIVIDPKGKNVRTTEYSFATP